MVAKIQKTLASPTGKALAGHVVQVFPLDSNTPVKLYTEAGVPIGVLGYADNAGKFVTYVAQDAVYFLSVRDPNTNVEVLRTKSTDTSGIPGPTGPTGPEGGPPGPTGPVGPTGPAGYGAQTAIQFKANGDNLGNAGDFTGVNFAGPGLRIHPNGKLLTVFFEGMLEGNTEPTEDSLAKDIVHGTWYVRHITEQSRSEVWFRVNNTLTGWVKVIG